MKSVSLVGESATPVHRPNPESPDTPDYEDSGMSSIPKFKTKQAPYVHVATPWPTKRQSFRADSADKGSEVHASNLDGLGALDLNSPMSLSYPPGPISTPKCPPAVPCPSMPRAPANTPAYCYSAKTASRTGRSHSDSPLRNIANDPSLGVGSKAAVLPYDYKPLDLEGLSLDQALQQALNHADGPAYVPKAMSKGSPLCGVEMNLTPSPSLDIPSAAADPSQAADPPSPASESPASGLTPYFRRLRFAGEPSEGAQVLAAEESVSDVSTPLDSEAGSRASTKPAAVPFGTPFIVSDD